MLHTTWSVIGRVCTRAVLSGLFVMACHYDLGGGHGVAPTKEGGLLQGGASGTSAAGGNGAGGRSTAGSFGAGNSTSRPGAGGKAPSAGGAGGRAPFDAGSQPDDGPVSGHVVSASPGADATKVDTHAVVSLTLDRAAAPTDVEGVAIESTSGVSVSVTASVAGNTLTL